MILISYSPIGEALHIPFPLTFFHFLKKQTENKTKFFGYVEPNPVRGSLIAVCVCVYIYMYMYTDVKRQRTWRRKFFRRRGRRRLWLQTCNSEFGAPKPNRVIRTTQISK